EDAVYIFQPICNSLFVIYKICAKQQILVYAEIGKKPSAFRHMGHAQGDYFMSLGRRDVMIIEDYLPRCRVYDAAQALQNGRFPVSVAADQRYDLTLLHAKRNVMDHRDV